MADDTVPAVAAEERRESEEAVDQKANKLATLIKNSKHFIAFTGAGVSTSAGIPDFRGPDGNWTLRAQGRARTKTANTLQAIPTPTHMALVELQNRGILKYLVSQNCDGLHRRSGIFPVRPSHPGPDNAPLLTTYEQENISELHGNSNREVCRDCNKEFLRDFRAVATYEHSDHDHRTGRKCGLCGGALHDTIVNFGEYLPEKVLQLARNNAKKADLCLALGSSLTVPPANEIPGTVGRRKAANLVICNLQTTDLDGQCAVRVFTEGDILMKKVMEKLGLTIPTFKLRRLLVIKVEIQEDDRYRITATGVDTDGTPQTFLQSVRLEGTRRVVRAEPFVINVRDTIQRGSRIELGLEFMGHYGEPDLRLAHEYDGAEEVRYLLEFDPQTGEWRIQKLSGLHGNPTPEELGRLMDVVDLTDDGEEEASTKASGRQALERPDWLMDL